LRIDIEDFRRHYAALSDEELLEIDRSELAPVAQKCYDEELAKRELSEGGDEDLAFESSEDREELAGEEPDWFEGAAVACSFTSQFAGDDAAVKADHARAALEDAAIPCQLSVKHVQPPSEATRPYTEYELLVPARLMLEAVSVLDKEVFNAEMEADWRTHMESLSDEELQAADPQAIVAGLYDRIQRLNKIYKEEMQRRGLRPRAVREK
jgi:hypothetical protein